MAWVIRSGTPAFGGVRLLLPCLLLSLFALLLLLLLALLLALTLLVLLFPESAVLVLSLVLAACDAVLDAELGLVTAGAGCSWSSGCSSAVAGLEACGMCAGRSRPFGVFELCMARRRRRRARRVSRSVRGKK
jgi:hypothetical protein